MLRQLMRYAVMILGLVALSGCGIDRLTGPNVDIAMEREGASRQDPRRDEDPRDPPASDPAGDIAAAHDSLRAGNDRD